MNPIADYMTAGTELPAYLPYPRFLLETDLSHTARELYALLLDRSTLSQKNGWQDSEGRTYIVYPIAEIAEMLDKGCTTIKGALNELDAAGLLERRRTAPCFALISSFSARRSRCSNGRPRSPGQPISWL